VSSEVESGKTPATLICPQVGLSPTTPFTDAGMRMLPPVSEPSAPRHVPAATDAAEPPELPPGNRAGSHGLRAGALTTPAANSCVTVLPSMIAPSFVSEVTASESALAEATSSRRSELQRVGLPVMSKMSFTPIGMPSKGGILAPDARKVSAVRACASASSA
jgi:hypothetical protein